MEQKDLFGMMDQITVLENEVSRLTARLAELAEASLRPNCKCYDCMRDLPGRSFQEWLEAERRDGR